MATKVFFSLCFGVVLVALVTAIIKGDWFVALGQVPLLFFPWILYQIATDDRIR